MATDILTLISLLVIRIIIPVSLTLAIGLALSQWEERHTAQANQSH
jgi:hypothetical protein